MSVDRDILEGLVMLDQRLPTPDTSTAYEQIVHEGRTRTRRARLVQTGLLAAAVVAVVASGQIGVPGTDPGPASDAGPAAVPVDRPGASTAASVGPASGLDGWEDVAGTWTARNVSVASMVAHLDAVGTTGAEAELRRVLPRSFADGADLRLEFHLGRATLQADGEEIDLYNYSVEDDATLFLRPLVAPGGRARFAARIEAEQLRLRFLDTTVPSRDGISEELMMRALYTTVPFQRTDS